MKESIVILGGSSNIREKTAFLYRVLAKNRSTKER